MADVLPGLQRALDRRMDRDFPHPKPPDNQLALLRLARREGGITVREAADALLMKPNNVSAMVTPLVAAGLLERVPDPADRRIAHLHTTVEARRRGDEVDELRERHVAEALVGLTDEQVEAVSLALPHLAALTQRIHSAAG